MATATGLTITDATCTQTDIIVTGPTLVAGNKPAIQTFLNGYVFDPLFGAQLKPYVVTLNAGSPLTWTNMPSALTGAAGVRTKVPLDGVRFGRLTADVLVAGTAGAVLIGQLSLDGSAWTSGPQISLGSIGTKVSSFVAIGAQFQTDTFFRIAGQGGDGAADPQFGLVTVQFG
jgi:hypothetical protein